MVLLPRTWTLGRSRTQAPAAAPGFTFSLTGVSAAAATGLLVAGAGPTIFPFIPRVPQAGIFFTLSLPEATVPATGFFGDARPGGVAGLVVKAPIYIFPRTSSAVAAIGTGSSPGAAAVVTASVAGVAGLRPPGFGDAHPGVFADSSPGGAGVRSRHFTWARVAAAVVAVAPHGHPRAAQSVAITSPDSLLRDAAVPASVFTGSSRVAAGTAAFVPYPPRGDPRAAV